ncbi:Odorant-binding protein 19a [Carabus blaptoides fortunei]
MPILLLLSVYIYHVHCMSEAQLTNAVRLVRNVCQPKFKVSNAQIENMHKGNFEDIPKLGCYMSCGLHALKFMKNGKMDYEYAKSQVKLLPENWQSPIEHSIDSSVGDDKCVAAYKLAQCMYNAEPDYYFLP